MPPNGPAKAPKSLQEVVEAVGVYPAEAYLFVQAALTRTVEKTHGAVPDGTPEPAADDVSRHIGGRALCLGLRDEAWDRWGLLARTVLARWNVTATSDFGRIVFALIDHNHLQKTDEDSIDDFRGVYDFRAALEADYRVAPTVVETPAAAKRAGKKST